MLAKGIFLKKIIHGASTYETIDIDPQDGKLLAKVDQSARVLRWAYSALHHWDFGWLQQRPLWDVWMLTWVTFGLILSVSSVVIGWRRLKQTFGFKKSASRKVAARKVIPRKITPPSVSYSVKEKLEEIQREVGGLQE